MSQYHSLSNEISERIKEDRIKHTENPYACKDTQIIRRYANHDNPKLWRPAFVMDVEKSYIIIITIDIQIKRRFYPAIKTMMSPAVHFMYS